MKNKLKVEIIKKRNQLTEQQLKERSEKIINNLKSLKEFKSAENILFYVSFSKEVDTQEIIRELLEKKEKRVIVPYTLKDKPIIFLSELKDFVELEPKTFGILEPKEKYIREFNREKLDVVIVPGIVFDKKGHRIGYGYGFYDRFLKTIKKDVVKIGLAFDFQLTDNIPSEEHDVPLNIIITEEGIIRCC
jgi:5-formyltetrahydrofolate cyclo-ligase